MNQEYVIRGNDVLLRCGIPSHVQDLVDVVSWHDSSNPGDEFRYISSTSNGKAPLCFLLAVIHQDFKVHVPLESYVIKGNDAIVKCEIPSFVGDLVKIFTWVDSSGKEYPATEQFSFGNKM